MASAMQMMFLGVGYAASSSCLVIINKWAVLSWPYASTLTFVQLTVSWMVALFLGKCGIVGLDVLTKENLINFLPASAIFFVALACNMALLQNAPVDTFVVMRSLIPLLTMLCGTALGKPLPGRWVILSLLTIVAGAVGYVWNDLSFSPKAYFYGGAYVLAMVVDTILVKKVVTKVDFKHPWTLVLVNNLESSLIYPFFAFGTGELSTAGAGVTSLLEPGSDSLGPVLISCVFGVSISYFGMNARQALSATSFSVLGVVCKFATVLVNTLIWSHHAGPVGIFFLCICVSGGILYQQALQRETSAASTTYEKVETKEKEEGEPASA